MGRTRIALALAAALALPVGASAQVPPSALPPPPAEPQASPEQPRDQRHQQIARQPTREQLDQIEPGHVLATLHKINRVEVMLGQMALQRARDPQVRELAQTLVQDHRQLDRQAFQLVQEQQLTLEEPFSLAGAALDQAVEQHTRHLMELPAREFDAAWLAAIPFQHEYALGVISLAEQAQFDDPRLNQLLQQARQAVEGHLQQAQQLMRQSVRVAGADEGSEAG